MKIKHMTQYNNPASKPPSKLRLQKQPLQDSTNIKSHYELTTIKFFVYSSKTGKQLHHHKQCYKNRPTETSMGEDNHYK